MENNDEEISLEDKMKKLRQLITEVQKNQCALVKVLQEQGVFSASFTRLTHSKIFQEEQEALNRAEEIDIPKRHSSIESLQLKFEKLKQKCIIKNRIIVALLKGLHSNGSKEWWEDLIDCIFDEVKPEEEVDYKMVDEYVSHTSNFIKNGRKALDLSSQSIEELLCKDIGQSPSNQELMTSTSKSDDSIKNCERTITHLVSKKKDHLLKYFKVNPLETWHSDNSRQASVIQKILYEDSQAGVAVVDLFVSVKKAKDKLEMLAKINDEVSSKASSLKNDSISLKSKFDNLMDTINEFFDRVNVLPPQDNEEIKTDFPLSVESDNVEISSNPKTAHEELLRNRIKHYKSCQATQPSHSSLYNLKNKSNHHSLDCFPLAKKLERDKEINKNKGSEQFKIVDSRHREVGGALLRSPLKNKKDDNDDVINREHLKRVTEVKKARSQELEKLGQNTFGIVSHVRKMTSLPGIDDLECKDEGHEKEILKVSYHELNKNLSSPNLSYSFKSVSSSKSIISENMPDDLIAAGSAAAKKEDAKGNKDDAISEGSSIFEEALSEWVTESKTKFTINLEDSTNANKTKKSASTLTADNDLLTSWISKLAEDLKSKIRTLKLDSNNQVFFDEKSTAAIDNLEFNIKASTPFGMFDIVIKEYRTNTSEAKFQEDKSTGNQQTTSTSDNDKIIHSKQIPVKENDSYWSEDSLPNSDSDYLSQVGITSAEDEMEEFIEANLQRKSIRLKGTLNRAMLKTEKVPFFEIQKCVPKYFFHELLIKGQVPSPKVIDITNDEVQEGSNQNFKDVIDVTYSDNFIIYIQVELDEKGEENPNPNEIYIECKPSNQKIPESCVDQEEVVSEHESVMTNEKERFISAVDMEKESEGSSQAAESSEAHTSAINSTSDSLRKKISCSELIKKNCWGKLNVSEFRYSELKSFIFKQTRSIFHVMRMDVCKTFDFPSEAAAACELDTAIKLVREIESNVVDAKLNAAILILPKLESELRKHMQNKREAIAHKDLYIDPSVYYSASGFPLETEEEIGSDSEERFRNLLRLLSNLEDAIKENQTNSNQKFYEENSSTKIFKLLHCITNKLEKLEDETSFSNLEEMSNATSQLDSSVRVSDNPLCYPFLSPLQRNSEIHECQVQTNWKKAGKRTMESAAKESAAIESRIEKDYDRIERLERENDEALKFVEAFVDKTARRTAELESLKAELKSLSATLEKFYVKIMELKKAENEALQNSSSPSLKMKEAPLKNTVSGLLRALDNLKNKAREKNKACQKILKNGRFDNSLAVVDKPPRTSRSSFTAKSPEALSCNITEVKRIDDRSLYLAWTKPKGNMAEQVIGYEIVVNGTLNQKVRNPRRTQAVLYSADVNKKLNIKLYGLFLNKPKIPLAVVRYCEK